MRPLHGVVGRVVDDNHGSAQYLEAESLPWRPLHSLREKEQAPRSEARAAAFDASYHPPVGRGLAKGIRAGDSTLQAGLRPEEIERLATGLVFTPGELERSLPVRLERNCLVGHCTARGRSMATSKATD